MRTGQKREIKPFTFHLAAHGLGNVGQDFFSNRPKVDKRWQKSNKASEKDDKDAQASDDPEGYLLIAAHRGYTPRSQGVGSSSGLDSLLNSLNPARHGYW